MDREEAMEIETNCNTGSALSFPNNHGNAADDNNTTNVNETSSKSDDVKKDDLVNSGACKVNESLNETVNGTTSMCTKSTSDPIEKPSKSDTTMTSSTNDGNNDTVGPMPNSEPAINVQGDVNKQIDNAENADVNIACTSISTFSSSSKGSIEELQTKPVSPDMPEVEDSDVDKSKGNNENEAGKKNQDNDNACTLVHESDNDSEEDSKSASEVENDLDDNKKMEAKSKTRHTESKHDKQQHVLEDNFGTEDIQESIDLEEENEVEEQEGSEAGILEIHDVEAEQFVDDDGSLEKQEMQGLPTQRNLPAHPPEIQELTIKVSRLQSELEDTKNKLTRAEKKLSRSRRHKESAESYNYDLRKRVKHLRKELHRFRREAKKTFAEVGCQTRSTVEHEHDDVIEIPSTSGAGSSRNQGWDDEGEHGSIADSLKATAEEALSSSGYVLDPNSGLYYDYSTGYYYDPNNHLYYDPTTGVYYFYDQRSRSYQFHSQVSADSSAMLPHSGDRQRRGKRKKDKRPRREIGDVDDMECEVIEVLDDDSPEKKRPRKVRRKSKQKGGLIKLTHTATSDDTTKDAHNQVSPSKDTDNQEANEKETDSQNGESSLPKEKKNQNTPKKSTKTNSSDKKTSESNTESKEKDETSGESNTSSQGKENRNAKKSNPDLADEKSIKEKSDDHEPPIDQEKELPTKESPVNGKEKASSSKESLVNEKEKETTQDEDCDPNTSEKDAASQGETKVDSHNAETTPPVSDEGKQDFYNKEGNGSDDDEIMEVESKRREEIEEITILDSEEDSEMEDGELTDSSADFSSSEDSSEYESDVVPDYSLVTRQDFPPCIRMIVTRSEKIQLGTLYVVPCTGGTIGREGSGHVVTIPELGVSKQHAEIVYNTALQQYCITDLGSQNGTIINGKMLSKARSVSDPHPLNHKDYLTVGSTTIRVHIHPGEDTCDECEPGQVQALITQSAGNSQVTYSLLTQADKEQLRRKELKKLKKKYNLLRDNYGQQDPSTSNASYTDRAGTRRKTVGSDNPYQPDEVPASVDRAISETNVGRKMLEKMGWKEGKGLGKEDGGITEPIQVLVHGKKKGLGAGVGVSMDQAQYITHGRKNERWQKAKARFDKLQHQSGNISETITHGQWVKGSTEALGTDQNESPRNNDADMQEDCIEILSPGSEETTTLIDEVESAIPTPSTADPTIIVSSSSTVTAETEAISDPSTSSRPKIQLKLVPKRGKEQLPTSSVALDDSDDETVEVFFPNDKREEGLLESNSTSSTSTKDVAKRNTRSQENLSKVSSKTQNESTVETASVEPSVSHTANSTAEHIDPDNTPSTGLPGGSDKTSPRKKWVQIGDGDKKKRLKKPAGDKNAPEGNEMTEEEDASLAEPQIASQSETRGRTRRTRSTPGKKKEDIFADL